MQLLPAGSGALSSDTLLLFFQPSHACDTPTCHALFIEHDVIAVRIMGSGFAAVTFKTSGQAEAAYYTHP